MIQGCTTMLEWWVYEVIVSLADEKQWILGVTK